MKYWGLSWDEVLNKRSFINIMMLGKSIPEHEKVDDKDGKKSVADESPRVMTGAEMFKRFKK